MIKAIAGGFRWRKLLETGIYETLEEIAAAEKINPSYVSRLHRTTLLVPEVVEAILDGRQPADMPLALRRINLKLHYTDQKNETIL
jgi:hypothetical protein